MAFKKTHIILGEQKISNQYLEFLRTTSKYVKEFQIVWKSCICG